MKRILYIIDDVNYDSGAKAVTLFQMKMLQEYYDISLLTLAKPKEYLDFLDKGHILDEYIWKVTQIYATSFKKVMREREYSVSQKISRLLYALCLRLRLGNVYFERLVKKRLVPILETFDTVIVVSEASKLRSLVSGLQHPKKIQWIHTDYARWSEFSEWTRAITYNDAKIYSRYDVIVALSEYCKKSMLKKIPELENKIVVIPNLIDGERILSLANTSAVVTIDNRILNYVTVARLDVEKGIDQLLEIAKKLKDKKVNFRWYIIGDGPLREEMDKKRRMLEIEDCTIFLGYMENPYSIMSRCDLFVLLSKYEGTPVTIDEAMILGLNIIAPKIGGIQEQTKDYPGSCLYENNLQDMLLLYKKGNHRRKGINYMIINKYRSEKIKGIL